MDMKPYSIRLDKKLSEIIERNAGQQEIKVTRYIRSLIEKGLVVDTQIQQGILADKQDNSKSYFDVKMAHIATQSLVLSRKIMRAQAKSVEQAEKEIKEADVLAQEYVEKLISNNTELQ